MHGRALGQHGLGAHPARERRRSNAKETANGQTALMFAAAADRLDVVKLLLARGADLNADLARSRIFDALTMTNRRRSERRAASGRRRRRRERKDMPGVTRPYNYNELIGKHGGLAALHFAARQGATATVESADQGRRRTSISAAPATRRRRSLVAAINGHFDLASYLLDNGADPNLASEGGVTPLYAVINVQWQPRRLSAAARATCSRSSAISS